MSKKKFLDHINIKNKKASFEYHLMDTYVAGMVLGGTEIKSSREGNVNLQDAYCVFIGEELFVRQLQIAKYDKGTYYNHEPFQDRKLLLTKKELRKIVVKSRDKGLTIIPTRLFVTDRGYAKLEIAIAKGKKLYDKREDIKEKDLKRELDNTKL